MDPSAFVVIETDFEAGDDEVLHATPVFARGYVELISSELVDSFTTDNLRKAIGNIVKISRPAGSADTGAFEVAIKTITHEDDLREVEVPYINCDAPQIFKLEVNTSMATPIDSSLHIPNIKIPFRLYADPETTHGDIFWREYMTGGSFGGVTYENLLDASKVYYDIAISFKIPMTYQMSRACEFLSITPPQPQSICTVKANYLDYNFLVQNYQDWSSELSSELLIPNYYINSMKLYRDSELDFADASTIKAEQMGFTKQKQNVFNYHFDTGRNYSEMERDQYYGSHFITHTPSDEYQNAALTQQQNLMFDDPYFSWLADDDGDTSSTPSGVDSFLSAHSLKINEKLSTFYNIEINFDRHKYVDFEFEEVGEGDPTYKTELPALKINSLQQPMATPPYKNLEELTRPISSKFLELLKDIDEGTITDLPIRTQAFNYLHQHGEPIMTMGVPTSVTEVDELPNAAIGLKTINFLHFLTYAYNNYNVALNDNFLFMGKPHPAHAATMAKDTLYRNQTSQQLLKSIDNTFDFMNYYFHLLTQQTTGGDDSVETYGVKELNEDVIKRVLSPTMKFYEVVAYKIEKIGGNPSGDSSTSNVIQKFWVYNSPDAADQINIVDSQVKYGKSYTYKISAYALVMAHKYKYADFRLTKQIGTGQKVDPDDTEEVEKFCLQFYDPSTENKSSQLFTTTTPSGPLADFRESALAALGQEFTNDQIDVSEYPQVADFHLMVEPCLELIEIPMHAKTVKVVDSPPNAVNVIPFHFIDNSRRVGFKIGQDSYIDRTYPLNITVEDLVRQDNYLNSREILAAQKITEPSQSPARYIEMYRIKEKPNSFTDFAEALVSTIDLRQPNSVHNFHDYIAADKITPNRKYYYLFRLVNENGMPGPLSQIIECELVNDGGYTYSLFDTVDSSEFSPNKITTTSKVLKKIMQLEPHISQMLFDTSDMDFDKYAFETVDDLKVGVAEQLIWNRRFKIRLTSKKTGRKIDLNTGFNLRTRDLTKLSETMPPPTDGDFEGEEVIPILPLESEPEGDGDGGGGDGGGGDGGGGDGGTVDEEIEINERSEEWDDRDNHLGFHMTRNQYSMVLNPEGIVRSTHDSWFGRDGIYPAPFSRAEVYAGEHLAYLEQFTRLLHSYRFGDRGELLDYGTPIDREDAVAIIGAYVGLVRPDEFGADLFEGKRWKAVSRLGDWITLTDIAEVVDRTIARFSLYGFTET
jgi:hypothetical protein